MRPSDDTCSASFLLLSHAHNLFLSLSFLSLAPHPNPTLTIVSTSQLSTAPLFYFCSIAHTK